MGYLGQDGILEGTEYDKYNFRINTTSSLLKDRLKISTNVAGYSGVKNDLVDGTGNTLYRIVAMSPMVNAKMEGYGWTDWFYDDAVREAGGFNKTKTGNFSGNINLQLSLLKNLRLEGAVNYDRTTETGQIYAPNVDLYKVFTGADGTQTIGKSTSRESSITESTYRYGNLSSYVTLSYWATAGDHHNFKVLAGWQQGQWDNKYYKASRTRLTTNLPSLEVGDPSTPEEFELGDRSQKHVALRAFQLRLQGEIPRRGPTSATTARRNSPKTTNGASFRRSRPGGASRRRRSCATCGGSTN